MVRPSRSRLVTQTDIVLAFGSRNMIKITSANVQSVGISAFAALRSIGCRANARAIAKVAGAVWISR
jgi:hypothetical protein